MPETALTVTTTLGSYPTLPITADAADVAFVAMDDVNGNSFSSSGTEIVIVNNTDAGAQTVTFTSQLDSLNRTGDITAYSIGAGEYAIFGPFKGTGWKDSSNNVLMTCSDATVEIIVIRPG